jgi:hypothetical protein
VRAGYRISRVVVAADSLALLTLDQAKAALGIDLADTSQDAALTQHIAAVSTAIDNWCNRIFVRQTYRDQLRHVCSWMGTGEPLNTRQWPIGTDVDGEMLIVTEDGIMLERTAWEADAASGEVYRLDNGPSAWSGSTIILDYDGGYDEIPADVQSAALEWLTARWSAQGRDPALRSETIPDVITQVWSADAVSTTTSAMPALVRDWLAPYQRWFV